MVSSDKSGMDSAGGLRTDVCYRVVRCLDSTADRVDQELEWLARKRVPGTMVKGRLGDKQEDVLRLYELDADFDR